MDRSLHERYRNARRVILTFVNIVLAAGAVGLGFLYWYQERLVYFPTRVLEADPGSLGLSFEPLSLTTDDGVSIHGWWVPAANARATVLYFHGNAGNMSHRLRTVAELLALDLSVLLIDYRGYGESRGSPSERGTYLDAEAAWRFLTDERGIPADEIVVLGRSLGGGVATWLAEKYQPAGLWLESTFVSLKELGRLHYPWLPVLWLLRIQYPNLDRITQIDTPLMLAHSPADSIVPFEHGARLFEAAATTRKWFLEVAGGHNADYWQTTPAYRRCWSDFIGAARGERRDAPDCGS